MDNTKVALKVATITRLNIEHYHRRLAWEIDGQTRETILRLLADEEDKLKALARRSPADDAGKSWSRTMNLRSS